MITEDKNTEWLQQLANEEFKKFYLENPKEQKFLFSKVDVEELVVFSSTEFSLADVLKCRYIETYLKNRNIQKSAFKKVLLKHIKNTFGNLNVDENKKIKKHAVSFIEERFADEQFDCPEVELTSYNNFKRDEQRYLTEALIYIFKDKNILDKFKEDGYYKIKPLEAMFMFFILDDKNKEELKHIRFCEEHLIKRKYMNTLRRYALAISETRGWSSDTNHIRDVYDKRLQSLKSDLPAVRNLLIKVEKELDKNDNADFEKIIERVTKCRKKLKKFIKRYEQLSLDKVFKEH